MKRISLSILTTLTLSKISLFGSFFVAPHTPSLEFGTSLSGEPYKSLEINAVSDAETEFYKAKGIAEEAYQRNDYTMLLAITYAGIFGLANINDFGGDFHEFGAGPESFKRLLENVRSKIVKFKEPTLEEVTAASTIIRERIFTTPIEP